MDAKYKKAYKVALDQARHQERLLFDRLNYFLAGSAFLVTAYAALVVSVKVWSHSDSILRLTYIVNGTGFYLSIFFAIINYLNTRIIGAIFLALKRMESDEETDHDLIAGNYFNYDDSMADRVMEEDFNRKSFCLMIGPLKGALRFLTHPFQKNSKDKEAPHTYLIPLVLAAFWLIVFICIFRPDLWQISLFSLPLIFVINTSFLSKKHCTAKVMDVAFGIIIGSVVVWVANSETGWLWFVLPFISVGLIYLSKKFIKGDKNVDADQITKDIFNALLPKLNLDTTKPPNEQGEDIAKAYAAIYQVVHHLKETNPKSTDVENPEKKP